MKIVRPSIELAENAIKAEIESVSKLADVASNHPYYKFVVYIDTRT